MPLISTTAGDAAPVGAVGFCSSVMSEKMQPGTWGQEMLPSTPGNVDEKLVSFPVI